VLTCDRLMARNRLQPAYGSGWRPG
jgi:hypothetical protein